MASEVARIETAYSYIRLSSKKQLKGTGEHRQTARTQAICDQMGWQLSPQTFQDLGVSAFTGENRLTGALAEFIRLAKAGKLAPNPVLILEAWDRFSRQDLDESEKAVLELLRSGVAIHIGFGNRTFTRASTRDLAARVEILVAMKGAFDYSANLSRRVKSAKSRKISRIADGGTANVREMAPRWLNWNNNLNRFETNEKADLVREIFTKYNAGASIVSIVKDFNQRSTPAFRGGKWHTASVRYILSAKTTIGDFKGHSYFPRIVSQQEFDRAQVTLEKNRNRRGRSSNLVNLFRGLIFCSECGFAVTMTRSKGRNYSYYRCTHSVRGACTKRFSLRINLLEEDFFVFVLRQHPEIVVRKDNQPEGTELDSLRLQKLENDKKKRSLLNLLNDYDDTLLRSKYAELTKESEAIDRKIIETTTVINDANNLPHALGNLQELIDDEDSSDLDKFLGSMVAALGNRETRVKLAPVIASIVKRIDVNLTTLAIRTTFVNGNVDEHQIIH